MLRRILRRAVRYASEKLGAKPGVFAELVDTVVNILVSTINCYYKNIHYSVKISQIKYKNKNHNNTKGRLLPSIVLQCRIVA